MKYFTIRIFLKMLFACHNCENVIWRGGNFSE